MRDRSIERLERRLEGRLEATDWDEASFTRPMGSPFASAPPSAPHDVDVALEESALFERDTIRKMPAHAALRAQPTPPPRPRPSRLPPPRFDAESTTRRPVPMDVLHALKSNLDSVRLRAAHRSPERALDLSRTVEEPAMNLDTQRNEAR